ncbi:MAG: hypothetical protein HQK53_15190, partial [Oligoflexia bacterium]|nr:hypothetical protein [Oligoflexia bacterium]
MYRQSTRISTVLRISTISTVSTIFLILTLFLTLHGNAGESGSNSTRPAWINDPMSECQESMEICAVGSGMGEMKAEANARLAIAQIFETKIQGKKSFTKSTSQEESTKSVIATRAGTKESKSGSSSEQNVASSSVQESSLSQLDEITDAIVEGVMIKKKHQDKDAVYALAVLDKIKLQKDL